MKRFAFAAAVVYLGMTAAGPVSSQDKKTKLRPGEINTPPAFGERPQVGNLKVGDPAPDFSLPRLKDPGEVKLSSFQGKKPVVLIFGSFT